MKGRLKFRSAEVCSRCSTHVASLGRFYEDRLLDLSRVHATPRPLRPNVLSALYTAPYIYIYVCICIFIGLFESPIYKGPIMPNRLRTLKAQYVKGL